MLSFVGADGDAAADVGFVVVAAASGHSEISGFIASVPPCEEMCEKEKEGESE